jgi:hypothetical protein
MNGDVMNLFVHIITVLLMQTPASALQAQMGTASGVVRTAAGDPAVGVRVAAVVLPDSNANAIPGAMISLTQTDSTGRFRLENILPGRYFIQAGLIDSPTYYPGVATTTAATSVQITAGSSVDGLNFSISRGSIGVRVSGRVPTFAGRPVLIRLTSASGSFQPTTAQVRPDGTFEFLRVTPGRYTLLPTPANGLPNLQIVVADQDIDVGTPTGPGVTVSGTVGLGPHSPRLESQKVILQGSTSAWAQLESPVNGGNFAVAKVPPGQYSVLLVPGSLVAIANITVMDRDVTGVRVAQYAEIPGRAEIQDRSFPAMPAAWMIEAVPEKGLPLATAIRSDGTFRFPLSEGQYRITLGKLPAGVSVKALSYGSVNLLKDSLNLDGSSDVGELHVVLEMKSQ